MPASEPRRRPARREEDLVGGLPDLVAVEAVELPERPYEAVVLIGKLDAAELEVVVVVVVVDVEVVVAVVVVAAAGGVGTGRGGRDGAGVRFATSVLTHYGGGRRREEDGSGTPDGRRMAATKIDVKCEKQAGENEEREGIMFVVWV